MARLFPYLPFDPTETPLSFATRLASFHTGGRLMPFLRDLGVKPHAIAGGDQDAIHILCDRAGVEAAPVLANAAIRLGARLYLLRGSEISAEFLTNPTTVFCPACLKEDDDAANGAVGARRGRLAWTLRVVRTCPEHGIPLIHRNKERWDDELHELAVRVPERGEALTKMIKASEGRTPSQLQTYILDRLESRPGSGWLDSQSIEQAVRASEMLGVLLEFGATPNLNALTPTDRDLAGRSGYAHTAAGEAGIRDALHQVQAKFRYSGSKPGPRKVFGRLYEWLAFSDTSKPQGDIRRIVREHIFATMEVAPGKPVLGEALVRRRLHSVSSLAGESGLNAKILRNVLVAHGLVPSGAKIAAHHVFDAEAGRKIAGSVTRMVHVISLPKVLNCTRPQVDQLLAERLLSPLADDAEDGPGRTQKGVDAQEISSFLEVLLAEAQPVDETPDGMAPISKAAEKVSAPSVEIVHLILGGYLRRVSRLTTVPGYAGLLVDPEEVGPLIGNT